MKKISTVSYLVKLKKPSKKKHKSWLVQQKEYADCVNSCVERLTRKETLSSKNVPHNLKSAIKNEAIRRAKKALSDHKEKRAKTLPTFKNTIPISINNQNWDTKWKNNHWYIGFTTNEGKLYLPVAETDFVLNYFQYFEKKDSKNDVNREFRGTIQLLRKGSDWYISIPVQISCELKKDSLIKVKKTEIGIDLGLRHLAVVSEPLSAKRQFFSGKKVAYIRRHFRSLRRSLGKKKALRAIRRLGQKESHWMSDYNRKLANDIVTFALQFENPVLKMEKLENIRNTIKTNPYQERTIHSWAFYELQKFIKEKAEKHGIEVLFVNPAYTSQQCYKCKHTEKLNRNKEKFHCKNCGHISHADLNASKNIATSTSLAA